MDSTFSKVIIGIIAVVAIAAITTVIIMDPGAPKEEKNTANTSSNETSSEEENIDYMANAEKQVAEPEEGETVAVIHVKNFGDITVKFFNDVAPKAVENFTKHAKDGYYNGVTFHRVMNEFMIQGGDPEGTGSGGESIWGKGFEEEISNKIVPYRGSLCMASTGFGQSSLGSQFFITQANPTDEMASYFKTQGIADGLLKAYKKYGGYMSLNGQYTVFGQVVKGMDIVDKIAKTKVKDNGFGEKSVPVKPVVIEKIDVTTYKK